MIKRKPILLMQENLSVLRKICGWTTEEMGNRIGVTKQTISNLENYKVNMTKTQYIALRSVFEYEMNYIKGNLTLNRIMLILFYSDISYDEETKKKLKETMNNLAAAASGGIKGEQLFGMSTTLLAPMRLPVLSKTVKINDKPYAWLDELREE